MKHNNLSTAELRALLKEYNDAYYVKDEPLVSDAEYDALFKELQTREESEGTTADSPTQQVGNDTTGRFAKHTHLEPMLSIDDLFDHEDLAQWFNKVQGKRIVGENKFDGCALSLTYDNGTLELGVTRGDGTVGEVITHNAVKVNGVVSAIPFKGRVEIRGEVVLSKTNFVKANKMLDEAGLKGFVNCRNAASGILRQLEGAVKVVDASLLTFIPYRIVGDVPFKSQTEFLAWAEEVGFNKNHVTEEMTTLDELDNYYQKSLKLRDSLDFDIDGLVFKVNSFSDLKALGSTSRVPRGMGAYKFPPEEATTILRSVDFQVGKFGTITPVGKVDPVFVGGVTVSSVTLHNADELERLDVHYNDMITLVRSGDVIPCITGVIKSARPNDAVKVTMPETCPCCYTELVRVKASTKCTNPSCPDILIRKLEAMSSRKGFDIEDMGMVVAEKLVDAGITRPSEVFALSKEFILELPGFKERSAQKLYDAIQRSKEVDLDKFYYALCIPEVGSSTAKRLAVNFEHPMDILRSPTPLSDLPDIGEETEAAILDWLNDEYSQKELLCMEAFGVKPKALSMGTSLTGITFVVTGSFTTFDRKDLVKHLANNGAKVSGSVSKNTNYLVAGSNAGGKLAKATSLGVPVLSEEDLTTFLKEKDCEL